MSKQENELHSKEELIDFCKRAIDDFTYRKSKAKDPAKIRAAQNGLNLWTSFLHHLTENKPLDLANLIQIYEDGFNYGAASVMLSKGRVEKQKEQYINNLSKKFKP